MATESLALQLREQRAALVIRELEAAALALFSERSFKDVTVDEIVASAQVSPRTFYRYFSTKEDVLQVQIDRRTEGLRAALAARSETDAPLGALRVALAEQIRSEDKDLLRRWIAVIRDNPSVLNSVIGGIQLKVQRLIAEFLGARLGEPADALVPMMLAAASTGIIQAAHVDWFASGGDLADKISAGIAVLEANRLDSAPTPRLPAGAPAVLHDARERLQKLEADVRALAQMLDELPHP